MPNLNQQDEGNDIHKDPIFIPFAALVLPSYLAISDNYRMNKSTMYKRYRFPPEIIQYAVWLYFRFNLSHRDIEYLLAQRGIIVTHESIRLWCNKFRSKFATRLRRRHQGYGDTFFIDEVLSKLTVNNIICGALWIRMEKSLMY